jgi:SLOG in TRPM, prokaryote
MTVAGAPREARVPPGEGPVDAAELGVPTGWPVLAVAGTTAEVDPGLAPEVLAALKEAVALAARHGIAIVTGGTDAGIFHLLGLALSSSPARPPLVVGVAPDALVAPAGAEPGPGQAAADTQLDVLVRVPGCAWGDEVAPLSRLVAQIAGGRPSALLLVGGGEVSHADLTTHLAAGRPVVALAGSGRLADELATGTLPPASQRSAGAADGDHPPDGSAREPGADLGALVANGRIVCPRLGDVAAVRRAVLAVLVPRSRPRLPDRVAALSVLPHIRFRPSPPPPPLSIADARAYPLLHDRVVEAERVIYPAFAACDVTARREQNRHRWYSLLAIVGALLTTVSGAAQVWLASETWPGVAVVTFGALTSVFTSIARRQNTLQMFLDARTRAERLRALYFAHLARPAAADPAEAEVQAHDLALRVAQITSGPVTR